jgi:hypothetical protein
LHERDADGKKLRNIAKAGQRGRAKRTKRTLKRRRISEISEEDCISATVEPAPERPDVVAEIERLKMAAIGSQAEAKRAQDDKIKAEAEAKRAQDDQIKAEAQTKQALNDQIDNLKAETAKHEERERGERKIKKAELSTRREEAVQKTAEINSRVFDKVWETGLAREAVNLYLGRTIQQAGKRFYCLCSSVFIAISTGKS